MHGWQSESTDGPKGGWSCAFWSGCSGHLTHNSWKWCGVVWCSCSCSCSLSTICLSVYLSSICLSVYLSVCLPIHLPVCLSICPSASLKTKLFCKTSRVFEFDNINSQQVCETSWAFELDNVTTSKTQQLCEISWAFELDNVATSKTQQVCEISWVFELDTVTTSKTHPKRRCFLHFDFEMCFVQQRRALFPHLNFQKCSDVEVFFARGLRNMLRATAACNFSSHLTRWLRTRHPKLQGDGCWNCMKPHFCPRSTYLLPIVCTPLPMASPPRQLPPSLAANWSTLKLLSWYPWWLISVKCLMFWHQWSATPKKNR